MRWWTFMAWLWMAMATVEMFVFDRSLDALVCMVIATVAVGVRDILKALNT